VSPKSFDDLGPILQEEINKEVADFREYVSQRSEHPPAPLRAATARVIERVKRDARARNVGEESGSYDVSHLLQVAQESIERIAETKVAEKQAELQATRQELARVREMYVEELKEEKKQRVTKSEKWRDWIMKTVGVLLLLVATALVTRYIGAPAAAPPIEAP
jgi:hypothetical protein